MNKDFSDDMKITELTYGELRTLINSIIDQKIDHKLQKIMDMMISGFDHLNEIINNRIGVVEKRIDNTEDHVESLKRQLSDHVDKNETEHIRIKKELVGKADKQV